MLPLKGRSLLAVVTTITSLGFLMIGFDNGLMGGFVGAFVGAVITSLVGESLGRRKSIATGSTIMIVGAILQATAYSRAQLIVGRIVSGIGMGFINSTTPVFQSEFSPQGSRGVFVCMQISTLNFGIMLVYWIDFAFANIPTSAAWRVPTILQCFFLCLQLLLLPLVPDTPRWYANHDRPEDSLMVLRRLFQHRKSEEYILRLHRDIVQAVAVERTLGAGTWKDILKSDIIKSRRRFLLACGIQIMQQLGGNNAVLCKHIHDICRSLKINSSNCANDAADYANTLFQNSVGFSTHMAGLMSGYLNTWFFVASFIPYLLIDRVGRRPLLMSMIGLMGAVMAVQAALIYQVQYNTPISRPAGIAASAMLFVYLGAFAVGFQSTVWVYPSEILPLRLRQRGSSVSTASNWIFNYMVVQITPPSIQNIGWKTYIIFAVFNACWVPCIYFFYPETKGLQLEDVDRLFSKTDDLTTLVDDGTKTDSVCHVEHGVV
ncbi:hypothetical protein T310_1122 [Rasamsonia emersonii CBS 393.64]|uniref:Major facilitator superfamily (MFS) profile domain-containing protein n=1 Tax=Rasamsonia emersonii (strain ATCC 16479 / CBS 393.64 / IMI 116815) TaxID=1408163 RepID=A0A0F4Z2V3_RASE3|nr:hypothetical protein T310_1122 [Rasamsonia emersonii CBS 393.64]KKA24854.1 hypothetical protein T310_1122 [Rasamsonia emersonii CBS 393.64]